MLGMNDEQIVENRYLDTEDLSDSSDEVMNESESDADLGARLNMGEADGETRDNQTIMTGDGAADSQTSRARSHEKLGEESASKWSNPEYYTALPPPDESQRKKKDVVKLIRKARITTQKENGVQSQVVANDDFISFNFGDNQDSEESDDSATHSHARGKGVPGAPSGPRAFSHLQNLNAQTSSYPPGTDGTHLSAPITEPPPNSITQVQTSSKQTILNGTNGNRKRKRNQIDDEIYDELPRPPKRKRGKNLFANGYVLEEWEGNHVKNPVPWITSPCEPTEHAGFR